MLDQLKQHQINQQADALKLQQEISILKKEKLDLYQIINELQKRIHGNDYWPRSWWFQKLIMNNYVKIWFNYTIYVFKIVLLFIFNK